MPDRTMTMRRTASGLLIPEHVRDAPKTGRYSSRRGEKRRAQRRAGTPTPPGKLPFNRALRRKLVKTWRERKMARSLARRQAAEAIRAGTVGVSRPKGKARGCADDCPCRGPVPARP